MKKVCGMSLAMALSVAFATLASAQQDAKKTPNPATKSSAGGPKTAATEGARPLILSGSVPMEGVKGRFDHFASGQGQVFISALGNNTVEVISIFGGTVEHTITGVPGPQGVAFSPEANKLFVASEKGKVYTYDAKFVYPEAPTGTDPSIADATKNALLTYAPYKKPSFCLPPSNLNQLRIIHGSCRKASGDGRDALALVSQLIEQKADRPLERPHQLLLTGDQIYADDVAAVLLMMLTDAAVSLMAWDESMPTLPSALKTSALPPYARRSHLEKAKFTSVDLDNHLMSLGEYLCMYLFAWSDAMWTTDDKMPDPAKVAFEALRYADPGERATDGLAKTLKSVTSDFQHVRTFRSTLPAVRRVLANIPSYMIFDDHEVADDWNMTLEICLDLHGTELGRRMVQNALVAYALCQHWGNCPEQFESAGLPGTELLKFLDGKNVDQYIGNSKIRSIVSVHTDQEIITNQGSVYHGLARSAGLSYWESFGYTLLGSYIWETAGETTPAVSQM